MTWLKGTPFILIVSILFVNLLNACVATYSHSNLKYINRCQRIIEEKTKEPLGQDIDHAYVYIFTHGVMVAFTHGKVGTFGKWDKFYKQSWICAVKDKKVINISKAFDKPILETEPVTFEKYDSSVIEQLYKRNSNGFFFYKEQQFDKNNIQKNNAEEYKNNNVLN